MGGASTKLHGMPCSVETMDMIEQVCSAAEKLAAARCKKHSLEVYNQVTTLRELCRQWRAWQDNADQLQGHQVFAVAAALQTLSTKLEWCQHKLQQRHVSVRTVTLSSRHHAAQILQVLSTAKDALLTFSTAFRLAVMLSRERTSSTGSAQQQQQQRGASHSHTQEDYPSWSAVSEQQQQQQLGVQSGSENVQAHSPVHSLGGHTSRTAGATISDVGVELPFAHEQPQECIDTGDAGEVAGADTLAGRNTQQQPQQQHPCAPAQAISSSPPEPAAPAAATAACMHSPELAAVGATTAPTAAAAGIEPDGQLDAFDNIEDAAEWEHSEGGWQELLQRAWHGDAAAVLACAQELIHGGDYCLQDFGLAIQLLQTVVPQPCGSTACLWLGQLCERGLGCPAPDYAGAAAWYGKGAAMGHLECAQALGFYYEHGLGVEQDIQAAMEWYEFAADGGLPAAQNNLGQLLLHGVTNVTNGAATDAAAAVQLFQAAADQGSSAASFNLGMCHELGLCGKGPDAAAAAECYQFAGSEKALLRLGHLRLMQQDKAAAKEAFTAAAEAGSAEALLQLAKLEAANCSDEQQQQTLLLPAPLGLTGSCGGVGSLSAGGTYSSLPVSSISKDYTSSAGSSSILAASSSLNSSCSSWAASARADAALTLYQKAAAAGIAEAQHTVGCVCWGKGLVADAMQAWHAAAGQGYGPALLCLAAAAEKGLQGVRKDCAAARACYAMAAACGCEEGAAQLVLLDQEAVLQNSSWHCLGAGA